MTSPSAARRCAAVIIADSQRRSADAETAHGESMVFTIKLEGSTAQIAAADERQLHLLDLNGPDFVKFDCALPQPQAIAVPIIATKRNRENNCRYFA
jgi:hypothetical protein